MCYFMTNSDEKTNGKVKVLVDYLKKEENLAKEMT